MPTDTPEEVKRKKEAMLKAGREFKAQHGDKSPHTLAGASDLHITAVQILNAMGGKFKIDMFDFLLELHGIEQPEIMYHVINTVLRCHDDNQS